MVVSSSQKPGAESSGERDPTKRAVDQIVRESERKNTIINELECELATCKHHESELEEEVSNLRQENERLEHQLQDKQKENERTRADYQQQIGNLESQLKIKSDEVISSKE